MRFVRFENFGFLLVVPFFAPWLGPEPVAWQIFAAAAVLCVPFMLASMRVEAWSASRRVPSAEAKRWARWANLATYVPIIVVLVILAFVEVSPP